MIFSPADSDPTQIFRNCGERLGIIRSFPGCLLRPRAPVHPRPGMLVMYKHTSCSRSPALAQRAPGCWQPSAARDCYSRRRTTPEQLRGPHGARARNIPALGITLWPKPLSTTHQHSLHFLGLWTAAPETWTWVSHWTQRSRVACTQVKSLPQSWAGPYLIIDTIMNERRGCGSKGNQPLLVGGLPTSRNPLAQGHLSW